MKYLLEVVGFVLMAAAAAILIHDLFRLYQQSNLIIHDQPRPAAVEPRYRAAGRLTALGLVCLLCGLSVQVVPSGMAGVRVSQISGTLPGTLYPGFHLVIPLVQAIELYDTRDQIYETVIGEKPAQQLTIQTKEGLSVGLAVAVRYRLDPQAPRLHQRQFTVARR
ncbi:MAG: SPFH domain-containing protein [Ignavibacteriota bacterium]